MLETAGLRVDREFRDPEESAVAFAAVHGYFMARAVEP